MAQGDITRINTNIGALNALNSLKGVQKELGLHQLRLATGKRINESADDPAGLTIATKFQYRASGLGVALDNISDAKNLLSVAEGGLQKINDILIKMRDKAEQAASDTLGNDERNAIQTQLGDWASEINDIVETTKWNGKRLLDGLGDFTNSTMVFQVGVETNSNERISLAGGAFGSVAATGLGIGSNSATATEVSDPQGLVGAGSLVTADVLSSLTELPTGTYTVRVVIGAVDGSAADSYAQLYDANNNLLTVDANGDGAVGLTDNKVTFKYDNDHSTPGSNIVNFGNGLKITLADALTAGVKDAYVVNYSRAGTYNGNVSNATNARDAVNALVNAIGTVSSRLQTVGTVVSRMNFREETLTVAKVNNEAAFSRIMNADMAYEQLEATKYQILQQTATAMLGQANMSPQNVLSLFR